VRTTKDKIEHAVAWYCRHDPIVLELICSRIYSYSVLFFSPNKSANNTFCHGLLAKRTGGIDQQCPEEATKRFAADDMKFGGEGYW